MSNQPLQKDDLLLRAMVEDAIDLAERRHKPCFVGFLDEREQHFVQKLLAHTGVENYMFCGGYDGAERVVFGAFTPYEEMDADDFPITPITVTFRQEDTLSHRDFLGSLMALGIERDTVGDILVEPGRCVLFLRREIAPYVTAQITKIGRVGVHIAEGAQMPYPEGHRLESFSAVVSSLRADCVVAACTGWSREKTKAGITAGLVTVNYTPCLSPSVLLSAGDRIAIRGKGKFCIGAIGGKTRKGRIGMEVKKYL